MFFKIIDLTPHPELYAIFKNGRSILPFFTFAALKLYCLVYDDKIPVHPIVISKDAETSFGSKVFAVIVTVTVLSTDVSMTLVKHYPTVEHVEPA